MVPVERVSRMSTESGRGQEPISERITVTLRPSGSRVNPGAGMRDAEELGRRLAEAITQLLVQSYGAGERSFGKPLEDGAASPMRSSHDALDENVSNQTFSNPILPNEDTQRGVQMSINADRMEWSLSLHRLM